MLGSVVIGVGTGFAAALAILVAGGAWMDAFATYAIAGICGLIGWTWVLQGLDHDTTDDAQIVPDTPLPHNTIDQWFNDPESGSTEALSSDHDKFVA